MDFALAGVNYFSDDHLEDALDDNVTAIEDLQLTWIKDTVGGGTVEWHRALPGTWRNFEEATGGTTVWVIRDGPGAVQGTVGYTVNYHTGEIRFAADQGGSVYYLTARSYDLNSAAADVWKRKQSYYQNWYEFASDKQRFARQQAFQHALTMEAQYRAQAGQNSGPGNLQTTPFVRTDLEGSPW